MTFQPYAVRVGIYYGIDLYFDNVLMAENEADNGWSDDIASMAARSLSETLGERNAPSCTLLLING